MKKHKLMSGSALIAVSAAFLLGGVSLNAAPANPVDDVADAIKKIDDDARGSAAKVESELSDRFATLAGSKENAAKVVTNLRTTEKFGYGESRIALELTQAKLTKAGITNPTPAQFDSALHDVLALRSSGQGWGQIANSMDVKVGDLMRNDHAVNAGRGPKSDDPSTKKVDPPSPKMPVSTGNARGNSDSRPSGSSNAGGNGGGGGNAGGNGRGR